MDQKKLMLLQFYKEYLTLRDNIEQFNRLWRKIRRVLQHFLSLICKRGIMPLSPDGTCRIPRHPRPPPPCPQNLILSRMNSPRQCLQPPMPMPSHNSHSSSHNEWWYMYLTLVHPYSARVVRQVGQAPPHDSGSRSSRQGGASPTHCVWNAMAWDPKDCSKFHQFICIPCWQRRIWWWHKTLPHRTGRT